MRFSLFWRLVIGYLAVFALLTAISVYAIQELRRFDVTTRSILERDHRVLDYEKKLADNLLSQIRYERKFVIAKDDALYREFLKFRSEFEKYLGQALAVSDAKSAPLLDRVKQDYARYLDLFAKERVQVKTQQNYAQAWYEKEKNKVTDAILGSLERLQAERHEDTYEKVRSLAQAGARAHRVAAAMASAASSYESNPSWPPRMKLRMRSTPLRSSRRALVELVTVPVRTCARSSSVLTASESASSVSVVVSAAVMLEIRITDANIQTRPSTRPPSVTGALSP